MQKTQESGKIRGLRELFTRIALAEVALGQEDNPLALVADMFDWVTGMEEDGGFEILQKELEQGDVPLGKYPFDTDTLREILAIEKRWGGINKGRHKEYDPGLFLPPTYALDFYSHYYTKKGCKALLIPIGKRESTDIRIIAAAVYYALYTNTYHGAEYSKADVIGTVFATIRQHFEDAESYIAEYGGALRLQILREWERCAKDIAGYCDRFGSKQGGEHATQNH